MFVHAPPTCAHVDICTWYGLRRIFNYLDSLTTDDTVLPHSVKGLEYSV